MLIRTETLKKIYRTEEVETTALNGVSLDIDEGDFVAIMGPSGCGKSTLLTFLGCWTARRKEIMCLWEKVPLPTQSEIVQASQRQHRIRVSEFQSDR